MITVLDTFKDLWSHEVKRVGVLLLVLSIVDTENTPDSFNYLFHESCQKPGTTFETYVIDHNNNRSQ